ncbi:MAG: TerB family tellurite resistance protein [Chloroherpetonaceae bacterium]|nr:TerB family tellurite resistance protein [Chloroherpetonaceae bacterium]
MQYSREFIEDLAFLYMTLAAHADGKLNNAEKEAIRLVLNVWSDGYIDHEMDDLLHFAKRATDKCDEEGTLGQEIVRIITRLSTILSRGKLKIIINDLLGVAKIDGEIHRNEEALIRTAADAWGFKVRGEAFHSLSKNEPAQQLSYRSLASGRRVLALAS